MTKLGTDKRCSGDMRVMPLRREDDSSVEIHLCRREEKPMGIAAADGEREMMPRGRGNKCLQKEEISRWKQMPPEGGNHAAREKEMAPLVYGEEK